MQRGLVGSEMCIRDSSSEVQQRDKPIDYIRFKKPMTNLEEEQKKEQQRLQFQAELKKQIEEKERLKEIQKQKEREEAEREERRVQREQEELKRKFSLETGKKNYSTSNVWIKASKTSHRTGPKNVLPFGRKFYCSRSIKAHVLCVDTCLLYTSPSPRDLSTSRMPSSA
eukprot:TRINITY_DN26626_c0_g1_i3.p1 TRINITY_DN26626_c0_g1~~TRINITY_DN26626_c0_g1_i3.p1  ORF type:complete len:169 (+),score=43.11 TRINITY_DN26626_c0_g1_i3:119-625(+)